MARKPSKQGTYGNVRECLVSSPECSQTQENTLKEQVIPTRGQLGFEEKIQPDKELAIRAGLLAYEKDSKITPVSLATSNAARSGHFKSSRLINA